MAYILDLNSVQQPTLDLTLCDPERTSIRVIVPTMDIVKEFQAQEKELETLLAAGTKASVEAAYDLIARLLSCNMEGLHMTADELLNKYRVNIYSLIAIYKAYKNFILGIEKN